jgi:hypothetical protein
VLVFREQGVAEKQIVLAQGQNTATDGRATAGAFTSAICRASAGQAALGAGISVVLIFPMPVRSIESHEVFCRFAFQFCVSACKLPLTDNAGTTPQASNGIGDRRIALAESRAGCV